MKVPKLVKVAQIPLFSEKVDYWAVLTLDNNVSYSGNFQVDSLYRPGAIFFNYDGKFVSFDGKNMEVIADDREAQDYILYYGKPVPIYRKGNGFVVGDRKYSSFYKRFGFTILQDGKQLELFTPFVVKEFELPNDFLVLPTHVSLLYDEDSVVVDVLGNVKRINRPLHFVGSYGQYWVFYSRSGRVEVTDNEGVTNSETFCNSPPIVVGVIGKGLAIECDDRIKVFTPNGWLVKNLTELPLRIAYYNNVVLRLEDGDLRVTNSSDEELKVTIRNVKSVIVLGDHPYVVHRGSVERLGFVICDEPIKYSKRVIDGLPAEVELEDCVRGGELVVPEPLVITSREGDKFKIDTKLLKEKIEVKAKITIEDVEISLPLKVRVANPVIALRDLELRVAERGHVVSSFDYNSVLRLKVSYELPSLLDYDLKVECCGNFTKAKVRGKGEELVTLYAFSPDIDRALVRVTVGNDYKDEQVSLEALAKIINVTPEGGKTEHLEFVKGGALYKVERVVKDEFAWDKLWITPISYYGVRFVKKGDKVTFNGKNITVVSPIEVDEGGKSVLVVPVEDPITEVKAIMMGERLNLDIVCKEPAVIEVFYAGQVVRSMNCGEVSLRLDPFYSSMTINAYRDGLVWSHELKLKFNLREALLLGHKLTEALLKEIKTYGLP